MQFEAQDPKKLANRLTPKSEATMRSMKIKTEDQDTLEQLFVSIREATTPKMWSKGVELHRKAKIYQDEQPSSELRLSIVEKGKAFSSMVRLWPQEEDWSCDCGSEEDPCEHVIASIIALRRSKEKAEPLPLLAPSIAKIGYRFFRKERALHFERVIVHNGKNFVLSSSLSAVTSGRVAAPTLSPSKHDLAIDMYLKEEKRGILSPSVLVGLLEYLEDVEDVMLDKIVIKTMKKPTGFVVQIEDSGLGVRLYGIQDPKIKEVFRNGVVLCDNYLRPINNAKLTPYEIKMLAEGRIFSKSELPDLVSSLLPNLRKKLEIEVKGNNLPNTVSLKPKIELITETKGLHLVVTPRVVYGTPPVAWVKAQELISLSAEVPLRNLEEERILQSKIFNEFQIESGEQFTLTGQAAVFFADKLETFEGFVSGKGLEAFSKYDKLHPKVSIDFKNRKLDIDFITNNKKGVEKKCDIKSILRAWKENESLVPLTGGGWAPLPIDWLERYGNQLLDLLNSREDSGKIPNCMILELAQFSEELGFEPPIEIKEFERALAGLKAIPDVKLPTPLNADLRSYQRSGVNWLGFLQSWNLGALLADDMGLGKTLQTICVLKKKSLVIAPTSVVHNWDMEIKRFRPNLKVCVYHGINRELEKKADVIITTYAIVRLDLEKLSKIVWDIIVCDEAQIIKNPDSQVAQAVYMLEGKFKITLSGTPIENRLDDIWSQFQFLNPGLLGSRKTFQKVYAKPISLGNELVSERLKERIKPFILRRLKSEVAKELPMRTNMVLYCELSEEERNMYEAIKIATRKDVLSKLDSGYSVIQALESLLRLRQASCHLGLLPNQTALESSKITLLMSTLETCIAGGHKALVFSQWTKLLNLIEPHLKTLGYTFLRIDGSTRNRKEIVEEFQTSNKYSILLLSLKAAGVGLNLTAADHVFIMDPWWNPAIEDQAADRAHRIGQTNPVMVQKLVSKNTVEEKILLLQQRKKELAEGIIGNGERVSAVSKEDIIALLE